MKKSRLSLRGSGAQKVKITTQSLQLWFSKIPINCNIDSDLTDTNYQYIKVYKT